MIRRGTDYHLRCPSCSPWPWRRGHYNLSKRP